MYILNMVQNYKDFRKIKTNMGDIQKNIPIFASLLHII